MSKKLIVNQLLMSKLRFTIMAYLYQEETMTFNNLLKQTEATRGNLSVQLKKLSDAGYISSQRAIKGSYTETTCIIEENGRKALLEHLRTLKSVVNSKK